MRAVRLAAARALPVLLVLAMAATAVQADIGLVVDRVQLEDADAAGPTRMLHAGAFTVPGALQDVWANASHAEVHVYRYTTFEAGDADGGRSGDYLVKTPYLERDVEHEVLRTAGAAFTFTEAQTEFALNIFSSQAFDLEAGHADMDAAALSDPLLHASGIEGTAAAQAAEAQGPTFTPVALPGTWVSMSSTDTVELVGAGDVVLEMRGVTLHLTGDDADTTVESGIERSGRTGTALDGHAHERHDTFVRIFLTGADFGLTMDAGAGKLEWVQASTQATVAGQARFFDEGRLQTVDEPRGLVLEPDGGRLAAAWSDSEPASAAVADQGPWTGIFAVGFLAVLSLLLTIVLAARVMRQTPSMDEVEAAMESGAFRRAASLARRIARRRPHMEEAVLSRAIALARSGQNVQVVREVGSFVSRRDPSDGTLHYVLGLAYLDLGRRSDATHALHEAARRTPALAQEVQQHLGADAVVGPIREVSGYA